MHEPTGRRPRNTGRTPANPNRERIDGRPQPRRRSAASEERAASADRSAQRNVERNARMRTDNAPYRANRSTRPETGVDADFLRKATPRERAEARRARAAAQRGGHDAQPTWYDAERAQRVGARTPRSALDTSQPQARWYSHGPDDVYVGRRGGAGAAHARCGMPVAAIAALAAAIVLIALVAFAVSSCTAQTPQDEQAVPVADVAPEPVSLTISFAGDCTLGTDENFSRSTSFNAMYDSVDDPSYFFENVASIFNSDDLSVANMEGTLTTATTRQDKTFAFKGPAEYAQILTKGGIETASLANNHSHDYGDQSYTDTIDALEAAGLGVFGYDRIDYRDVKGVKVALIGTYELAVHLDIQDELKQNIQTAKDNGAQIIVVYFHWGVEKDTVPNETQIELGHIAVDAGADLVIGSHPHVIQGYEKYNGRYIVYSLGNFCFGGNPNPSDKDCMIFQQTFTVTGDDVATDDAINVIPCSISSSSSRNNYQPTPAEGSEKTRITEKIQKSNDAIATLSKSVIAAASSDSTDSSQTTGNAND